MQYLRHSWVLVSVCARLGPKWHSRLRQNRSIVAEHELVLARPVNCSYKFGPSTYTSGLSPFHVIKWFFGEATAAQPREDRISVGTIAQLIDLEYLWRFTRGQDSHMAPSAASRTVFNRTASICHSQDPAIHQHINTHGNRQFASEGTDKLPRHDSGWASRKMLTKLLFSKSTGRSDT